MTPRHAALHGLAILKRASPAQVAERMGLDEGAVAAEFERAAASGRVAIADGRAMLTPLMTLALEADYSRVYAPQREDAAFLAAADAFERVNADVKALITDWQTGADRAAAIDRLGRLHDRAEPVLARLAEGVPRLARYADGLAAALERAEDGDHAWVSDVARPSYHTLWFELHEDLLRILGRARRE